MTTESELQPDGVSGYTEYSRYAPKAETNRQWEVPMMTIIDAANAVTLQFHLTIDSPDSPDIPDSPGRSYFG